MFNLKQMYTTSFTCKVYGPGGTLTRQNMHNVHIAEPDFVQCRYCYIAPDSYAIAPDKESI